MWKLFATSSTPPNLVRMRVAHQVIRSTSLQIPPEPETAANVKPEQGMEGPPQTPQPPRTCSTPGSAGKPFWSLDVRVAVFLVALAGAVILLLLYRLLQLRHRLRLARARHALEYYSFFHTATYTLKHPTPGHNLPDKTGTIPGIQSAAAVTPAVATPLPAPLVCSPPPLPLPPTPPVLSPTPLCTPTSLPSTPSVLAFPLSLPAIHTTPPSPHLSWGACSDPDLYSRIGTFRPSRLSSLSTHSKVILFEHSSL